MSFGDVVDSDPFSTALDRAVAATSHSVSEWYGRASFHAYARLTPAERADLAEYWNAMIENAARNAALVRAWSRQIVWDGESCRWVAESDEKWAARTAALKWQVDRDRRWRWIGSEQSNRRAA